MIFFGHFSGGQPSPQSYWGSRDSSAFGSTFRGRLGGDSCKSGDQGTGTPKSQPGGSDILKFITLLQDSEQMEKEKAIIGFSCWKFFFFGVGVRK